VIYAKTQDQSLAVGINMCRRRIETLTFTINTSGATVSFSHSRAVNVATEKYRGLLRMTEAKLNPKPLKNISHQRLLH
jgi:hypothetical protein